jgi:WD40 repeat protein
MRVIDLPWAAIDLGFNRRGDLFVADELARCRDYHLGRDGADRYQVERKAFQRLVPLDRQLVVSISAGRTNVLRPVADPRGPNYLFQHRDPVACVVMIEDGKAYAYRWVVSHDGEQWHVSRYHVLETSAGLGPDIVVRTQSAFVEVEGTTSFRYITPVRGGVVLTVGSSNEGRVPHVFRIPWDRHQASVQVVFPGVDKVDMPYRLVSRPDGDFVAVIAFEGLHLYDCREDRFVVSVAGVVDAAFTPAEDRLVTVARDGTVWVYDVRNGPTVHTSYRFDLPGSPPPFAGRVVVSPDGLTAAVIWGDRKRVVVFDLD